MAGEEIKFWGFQSAEEFEGVCDYPVTLDATSATAHNAISQVSGAEDGGGCQIKIEKFECCICLQWASVILHWQCESEYECTMM